MYDKKGEYYCLDTCRIITGDNIDYLIGILNSKLFFFAVKYFYGGGGLGINGVRMKHTFFENFSCPICDKKQNNNINKLVNEILNSRDNEYSKKIETEIDQIVYSLYGLTEEEIEFIDYTIQ